MSRNEREGRYVLRPMVTDRKCGISKSTRYRLEAQGLFPQRILLSENGRASGYYSDEVEAWLDSRPRAGGEAVKS